MRHLETFQSRVRVIADPSKERRYEHSLAHVDDGVPPLRRKVQEVARSDKALVWKVSWTQLAPVVPVPADGRGILTEAWRLVWVQHPVFRLRTMGSRESALMKVARLGGASYVALLAHAVQYLAKTIGVEVERHTAPVRTDTKR
eukprot:CAMPEP_0115872890 /NCGR_PEP_ID=MMETSP0287-20121206/23680_1 /TAXON_ID=412157 /ORGANISM="Chrysochromulina rotalis, Strain UIO044" /LENGTH=143 /DNA_ID=CAMNT_0003327867 /DNA_START=300 /DNA_END=733 /DNA_ORIENTATION=+